MPKSSVSAPERLKLLWPDVWALIRPRRALLAAGLVLMVINRVSGLVLPASTKYLVDDVIGKHDASMLTPLILIVAGATVVQGIT
ncbi:MAG: ABC transporter ATP-binding protein, partial [Acidobacteriota bacterium]|nr:ABC transporter ATP-binding protein [Acidobacteriota bacterium]